MDNIDITATQSNKRKNMEEILKNKPQYKECLFSRGYFITDDVNISEDEYPFFGEWATLNIGNYRVFVHKDQDYCVHTRQEETYLIIGHAYNPFNDVYQEEDLLEQCAAAYQNGQEAFFECVNDWTGIFALFVFSGPQITALQDCSGIKALYYGQINGNTVLLSHPQMAADIYGLEMDEFIKKLITNKFYNIGNRYLPGNLSPFQALRRIGANVYLHFDGVKQFSIHRFYPVKPHGTCETEEDYKKAIAGSYEILHKNIELIAKKWDAPAISLSGGTDSKTTLACANGLYDKFKYFSFQSKDTEVTDSLAAHEICNKIGLEHEIYPIPKTNEEIEDFDILKQIIVHSYGYVRGLNDNEVRKHIYLYRLNSFDVEVKSWISEIVRVFFDRKYGFKMPDKLTQRHFSIFQTRYFRSPELLRESDRIYKQYMKEFELEGPIFDFEHTDLYYWEVRMSSWGMMVTQSLDICHRITFPFNNRRLMELMFTIPREYRKTDKAHNDIIAYANREIFDANLHIKNKYFLPYRIWMEKLYYFFRTSFYKK